MRNLLSLAIVLALPATASAADPNCMVSFSGAEQNVCTGEASTAAKSLQSLLSLDPVKESTLRLVKFDGPITAAQRAAVEAAGAEIIDYAPHYAYIVRMPAQLDQAMHKIDGVKWSGPFMPALKVDPNIYNELKSGGIVSGLEIGALEISVNARAGHAAVRSSLASVPGIAVTQVIDSAGQTRVRATFDRASLAASVEQLALRDDVVAVGFQRPMRMYNSQGHWLHQSNVGSTNNSPPPLYSIWDQGLYGCGQIIGELDTGLWMDNIAFKDATQPMPIDVCNNGAACPAIAAPNNNARKVIAYYKWSGLTGGSWDDNHGHGTHVAGSIIGNDNGFNPGTSCNSLQTPDGTSNLVGMAPYAKLVMQESGGNLAYLNTQGGTPYHAADIAYQNGARIHSDSWGGGCTNQFGQCISGCTVTYDEESRDADRVMADHGDLLMVFAAGNDGTACPNGNNVGSPGNAKSVLTIGATGRGTAGNSMAGFSSRGPTLDSRTKPDLDAQGSGIISANRNATGTLSMSGTSMATPTAAGNAALVREYLARGYYPSGAPNPGDAMASPSGALVKAILIAGAFKMTGSGAGTNPGQAQGFGRILLDDSLYFAGDASHLFLEDNAVGLQTGSTASYQITAVGSERLTFVLTWSDVAGAVNASPATVNSLRLEVQTPSGETWTQKLPAGYTVNNATPTQDTTTSNYDSINTLQRIQFDAPIPGVYQVHVRGINVPTGPQKFALAATGNFEIEGVDLYKIKGTASNVVGSGLSLLLNGGNALAISGNGAFEFAGGLPDAFPYTVTVGTQPSSPPQECTVGNGAGTINGADVTNVTVSCVTLATYTVGGTVSGYTTSGLKLKLNNGSEKAITASGNFTFDDGLVNGASYAVTISAQPAGQTCTLLNANGNISGANVTNVTVNCADLPPEPHTVGGRVRGLTSPGLVLQLNGGVTLTQNTNGLYAFYPGVSSGDDYTVAVLTQPAGLECVVSNASGTMGFENVTNVDVDCAPPAPTDVIFQDGFESDAGATCTPEQLFQDPGFEQGDTFWELYDDLYGSPLCTVECSDDEVLPHGGDMFIWIGGDPNADYGYAKQQVTFPSGQARWLNWWLMNQLNSDPTAKVTVTIDDNVIETIGPTEQPDQEYVARTLPIPASYLDGQAHTVAINYSTAGSADGVTPVGVMLDDVTLDCSAQATHVTRPASHAGSPRAALRRRH